MQKTIRELGGLRNPVALAYFVGFMACIPIANWLIQNWGVTCVPDGGPCLVPVGWGLMAPSGVLVIGVALVLRDFVQEHLGWRSATVAILAGGVLSLIFSPPALAIASAAAFVISELANQLVYTPLRKKHRPGAVAVSQVVGAAVDSFLFVFIAFGTFEFGAGQTVAKIYAGLAVAVLMWLVFKRRGIAMASLPS